MVTYKNKEYANFSEFAKCYQNRYKNANFDKVDFYLSDKPKFDKSDIAQSGIYQLPNGKKFFITSPFEGNYKEISKDGNVKNCNDSLQIVYLEFPTKRGDQIIKLNDSTQVNRTLQSLLDKNPSGIIAKDNKRKKIDADVIRAKFADFEEFCCQIGYFLPNVDVDDAIAKFTEKNEEEQKANEIANIVKKMNVSIDVAEKIYNAMNA
jgi:hypothetical protein